MSGRCGARLQRHGRFTAWQGTLMLVLALALLPVAGCSSGSTEAPPSPTPFEARAPLEPVRVLYSARSPYLLPWLAAADDGLFVRNGLALQWVEEEAADAAFARLAAGDADVYLVPLSPALATHAAAGEDLVVLGGSPELAIIASRRLLAMREFVVERFLRTTIEGIHLVQAQPALAQSVLAKYVAAGDSGPASEAALAVLARGGRVPYITREEIGDLLSRSGQPADADKLLDTTILRRLEASGFVAALYRG